MTGGMGSRAALTEATLVLAALFWGGNYAVTKYAVEFLPPLLLVTFRFALGGLLLLCVLRLFEPGSKLVREDVVPMIGLGCLGVAAAQSFFTYGVSMTTAANTGLVFATGPVWGMLLAAALGLERPSRWGILGVALSILGVGIVVRGGLGAEGTSLAGDLFVLVAAVCVGAYTVFSMHLLERHSPLAVAAYPTLFGAPVVLLASLPGLPGIDWGDVGAGTWAAVGYSVVFATAFAFAAWQWGISRIGANRVLVYQYLITLAGVASGIVFLGERLGVDKVVGGAVILLGVYLARR
jgi:drug/metabolite transporter (DMT)-like permease